MICAVADRDAPDGAPTPRPDSEPVAPAGGPSTGSTTGPTKEPSTGPAAPSARRGRSVLDRVVIGLVILVVIAVGVLLGITVLPRWWAGRVDGVTDRSLTAGIFAGLTCGVVFTAIPLLLLRGAVARHRGWRARAAWFLAALVFAVPNLITLGIVLGRGESARVASTSMDVDAPGFRWSTGAGAVVGVLLVAGWWTLWASRRRRVREVHRLRAELAQVKAPPVQPPAE